MRLLPLALLLALVPTATAAPPLVIEARYPGASVNVVARLVAEPLEFVLHGTAGVRRVRSLSRDGHCFIALDLERTADRDKVRVAVTKRLAVAEPGLPPESLRLGLKMLPDMDDTFTLVVVRPAGDAAAVRTRLLREPGVSRVDVVGGEEKRLRIYLDPERLAARALDPAVVLARVQKAAKEGGMVEDLGGIVLAKPGGQPIYLRDVAAIEVTADRLGAAGVARQRKDAGKGIDVANAALLIVRPLPGKAATVANGLDRALAGSVGKPTSGVRSERRVVRPSDLAVVFRLPESASLERREKLARAAAEALVRSRAARAAYWLTGAEEDEVTVLLPEGGPGGEKLRVALRPVLAKFEEAAVRLVERRPPLTAWPGEGMQVVARLSGADLVDLRKTADRLRVRMEKMKGVVDLDPGPSARSQLEVVIDHEKIRQLGLQVADVAQILQIARGGVQVEGIRSEGRPITLVVKGGDALRSADDLGALRIRYGDRKMVPLNNIATLRRVEVPAAVYREDGRNCLVVSCNVAGRDVAKVREEVRRVARELAPLGVRIDVE